MNGRIEVAAGVIRKGGMTFICTRPDETGAGKFWEFPGGKCEKGESHQECVVRELREELGIKTAAFDCIGILEHDYPGKKVRVRFIRCVLLPDSPDPVSNDGQKFRWIPTAEQNTVPFLPADLPFAGWLSGAADRLLC